MVIFFSYDILFQQSLYSKFMPEIFVHLLNHLMLILWRNTVKKPKTEDNA